MNRMNIIKKDGKCCIICNNSINVFYLFKKKGNNL